MKEGEKIPVLLWIHGGPGGQTRLNYSAALQHLVNHGYAILAVNNRGSSGYGKTFFAADDRKHGDVDLKDCIEAKKYLATLPWVDTDKIGIYGGSYGGYMVMAALAFPPEEFKVGVNLFGVTNWLRTLKSIPPWWESGRKALYIHLGDPTQQTRSRSTTNHLCSLRIKSRNLLLFYKAATILAYYKWNQMKLWPAQKRMGCPLNM